MWRKLNNEQENKYNEATEKILEQEVWVEKDNI